MRADDGDVVHSLPDAVNAQIGAAVRRLRTARRLTQTDLARRLGVSFQQVQKYENGGNRISAARLVGIANAFGVPVGYFLAGLPGQEAASVGPGDRFAHLTPRQRRLVSQLVAELAG